MTTATLSPSRVGFYLDLYQANALSTAIYLPSRAIEYTTMGLCGECGEVAGKVEAWDLKESAADRADAHAELGDVCWYVATVAHTFHWKLSELHALPQAQADHRGRPTLSLALHLAKHAGEISNKAKKVIRDGRSPESIREFVGQHLAGLLAVLDTFAAATYSDLDTVMQQNLDKLGGRANRGTIRGDGDVR